MRTNDLALCTAESLFLILYLPLFDFALQAVPVVLEEAALVVLEEEMMAAAEEATTAMMAAAVVRACHVWEC